MALHDIIGKELPRTDAWHTLAIVDAPANVVSITEVPRPYQEPNRIRSIRNRHFLRELENTRLRLTQEANAKGEIPDYVTGDYSQNLPEGGIPKALFDRSQTPLRRLNFDGQNFNFHQLESKGGMHTIEVFPMPYSEWIACQNRTFTRAWEKEGRTGEDLPYAGVGISTVVESADGLFILTQRGIATTNYPGTLFTLGGLLMVGTSLEENLSSKIAADSGLIPGEDYSPSDIIVTAIGADSHYAGGKHARIEITAYLKTKSSWQRIVDLQKKSPFQSDVSGIVPLATDPLNFISRVASMGATGELLAAGEVGLVYAFLKSREELVGTKQAGKECAHIMKMLNLYQRKTYEAPKLR